MCVKERTRRLQVIDDFMPTCPLIITPPAPHKPPWTTHSPTPLCWYVYTVQGTAQSLPRMGGVYVSRYKPND